MIGVIVCAALALGIFALAALADERWPDRLSRRGQHLRGVKWRGDWGPTPVYESKERQVRGNASVARLSKPSIVGH
jgi:hypothetical protein